MWKRLAALFACFCLGFTMLYMRLLSLTTDEALASAGSAQSSYRLHIATVRGQIYDRNFLPLVNRSERYVAGILPTAETLAAVSPYLEDADAVSAQIQSGRPFAAELTAPVEGEGVMTLSVPERYSANQLAAHMIGYLNDGKGVSGIEKAFDEELTAFGAKIGISYSTDGRRRAIVGLEPQATGTQEVVGGVVTTLDSGIQQLAERAASLYMQRGAIIVMEPYTGDLLAVVSAPDYEPDNLLPSIQDEENAPLVNRAFSAYSLGSIFKLVTAATALEEGNTSAYTHTCTGQADIFGQIFRCNNGVGHGTLDMRGALIESCNTYFISLAQTLTLANLRGIASAFSFGKGSVLADGISSQAGNLPSLADLSLPAELANFSFGQGKLMTTPLQVAQLTSAIVNGGKTMQPRLVRGLTEDGEALISEEEAPVYTYAISEQTAATLRSCMAAAVEEKEGLRARPYTVTAGGKTATAQTGRFHEDGTEELQAWFTGFFPADEPKYVVTVLVEDGNTGNLSAGPVFRYLADALS